MIKKPFFNSWKLRFGDIDLSSNTDDEDIVQELRITRITKHPKYVEGVAYFDIAVLEIEPIEYTGYVRPVCMPSSKDFNVDKYEGVSNSCFLKHFLLFNVITLDQASNPNTKCK